MELRACHLFITSSTISKSLQDDGEMGTATLPPATHFLNILPKQTEAFGSIVTSQTRLLGGYMLQSQITVPV